MHATAVAKGRIAGIMRARGDLDASLRIRREEELPTYERLGDVRFLLFARWNLASTLLSRGRGGDREEARGLLIMALEEARRLQLPEAGQIEQLLKQVGAGEPGKSRGAIASGSSRRGAHVQPYPRLSRQRRGPVSGVDTGLRRCDERVRRSSPCRPRRTAGISGNGCRLSVGARTIGCRCKSCLAVPARAGTHPRDRHRLARL